MDPSGLDDIEVENGGVYWVPEAGGVGYDNHDRRFYIGHMKQVPMMRQRSPGFTEYFSEDSDDVVNLSFMGAEGEVSLSALRGLANGLRTDSLMFKPTGNIVAGIDGDPALELKLFPKHTDAEIRQIATMTILQAQGKCAPGSQWANRAGGVLSTLGAFADANADMLFPRNSVSDTRGAFWVEQTGADPTSETFQSTQKWTTGGVVVSGVLLGRFMSPRAVGGLGGGVGEHGLANQVIQGMTTRREFGAFRSMVREEAGTEILMGSREARRFGNHFDPFTNQIHLRSGSRNQPRGMLLEEIQHALDNALDPALNDLTRMSNQVLHAGTFLRMAESTTLRLTEAQRAALRALARKLGGEK